MLNKELPLALDKARDNPTLDERLGLMSRRVGSSSEGLKPPYIDEEDASPNLKDPEEPLQFRWRSQGAGVLEDAVKVLVFGP